jgi:hypothetical protein
VIEVLDPKSGALVASARVPGMVSWILNDTHVASIWESDAGEPLVYIWRAHLQVPR